MKAGHQIARHLEQKRNNAQAGSILGQVIFDTLGLNTNAGVDIGGALGGRAYSQKFELQADAIGTHIAYRAGFDPRVGAESFKRFSAQKVSALATHPASPDRIATVHNTYAKIRSGDRRITW